MAFDRRTILAAIAGIATSSCSRAAPATPPARLPSQWPQFKAAFVQPDGRVIDTGNGGISHSEGQGYGLLFAEAAADRATFDSLLAWTERTLSRRADGLFSWRYAPNDAVHVADPNNATDGDILIAWALTNAARRWNDKRYADRARGLRRAIHLLLVREVYGQHFLLPGISGFEPAGRLVLNPSYYVWPALDRFRAVDGDAMWGPVLRGGDVLLAGARFGPLALPTDWVDVTGPGAFAPALGKPPRFGFDAVRVPLYLAMAGRAAKAENAARFWRSYVARSAPIPAWVDVVTGETAPYPLSAGGMAAADRLLGSARADGPPLGDYYSAGLGMLASL